MAKMALLRKIPIIRRDPPRASLSLAESIILRGFAKPITFPLKASLGGPGGDDGRGDNLSLKVARDLQRRSSSQGLPHVSLVGSHLMQMWGAYEITMMVKGLPVMHRNTSTCTSS